MTDERNRFLNSHQTADYLGSSTRTFDRFRVSGDGLVFLKFGGRRCQ